MQRSPPLSPVPPTSPGRCGADHPGGNASPRKDPARITPRSPNVYLELHAPLRMGDFYRTDPLFKQLREALRPDPKAARFPFPLARLEELRNTIEVGVRDAERLYTLTRHAKCALYLRASKANQVALLGKIDDAPESELGGDRRATLRSACVALGDMLTSMMMRAEPLARAQTHDMQRLEGDDTGPASPDRQDTPRGKTRSPQKRAQDDQDSPVLTHTPPKRQKISTTATTTTAATPRPRPRPRR